MLGAWPGVRSCHVSVPEAGRASRRSPASRKGSRREEPVGVVRRQSSRTGFRPRSASAVGASTSATSSSSSCPNSACSRSRAGSSSPRTAGCSIGVDSSFPSPRGTGSTSTSCSNARRYPPGLVRPSASAASPCRSARTGATTTATSSRTPSAGSASRSRPASTWAASTACSSRQFRTRRPHASCSTDPASHRRRSAGSPPARSSRPTCCSSRRTRDSAVSTLRSWRTT